MDLQPQTKENITCVPLDVSSFPLHLAFVNLQIVLSSTSS